MRKAIFVTISFMVFGALGGCASFQNAIAPKWQWYKEGATQQDFAMDDGQCRAQAFSIPNAPPVQIAIVMQNCMIGKGWQKQNVR